jgi:hypothetical protein
VDVAPSFVTALAMLARGLSPRAKQGRLDRLLSEGLYDFDHQVTAWTKLSHREMILALVSN